MKFKLNFAKLVPVLKLINPYKKVKDYCEYVAIVENIHTHRDGRYIKWLKLINIILAFNVLRLVYLGLSSHLSALQHAILFDNFILILPRPKLSLIAAGFNVLIIYYNHTLMNNKMTNLSLLILLRHVLTEKLTNLTFFYSSTHKNVSISVVIRRLFVRIELLLEYFTLILNLMVLYTHLHYMYSLFVVMHLHGHESAIYVAAIVLCHYSMAFGFCLFAYNLAYLLTMTYAALCALLFMFYIKLRQCQEILFQLTRARLSTRAYDDWRKKFTESLKFFFRVNQMYGRLFLACLLVVVPSNIVASLWTIMGCTSVKELFFMISLLLYHVNFIFALHLSLAYCTKHIHKPSKLLFRLMVFNHHRTGLLRTRIKLANDIFKLHIINRYGFTYGNYGLVSLATFGKYLMLYQKIMTISYKLILKNKI